MNKSVSDERIICALLSNDTRKAAAKSLGMKSETLATRMKSADFQEKYQTAKAEMVKDITNAVQSRTLKAINAICEMIDNPGISDQVRLHAANLIVRYSVEFTKTELILNRMERIEERLEEQLTE